jgi:hypothetical protein
MTHLTGEKTGMSGLAYQAARTLTNSKLELLP